ncbi:hypothetical protein D3C85_1183270 [compost metagenome]
MNQGQPGENQRYAAQRYEHGHLGTEIRCHNHARQQQHRGTQRDSDGAKLATKTAWVVQQRLPVAPDNQAQHTDDLQQSRNQAGQDRCNQGRETRLFVYRQLLVDITE